METKRNTRMFFLFFNASKGKNSEQCYDFLDLALHGTHAKNDFGYGACKLEI